jgi:hypothetical protein
MKKRSIMMVCLVFIACTNGPCRKDKPIPDNPKISKPKFEAPIASVQALDADSASRTVFVYKPDGGLQCTKGKAMSLDEMETQLKDIAVVSRAKKSDGLMHIQICGQPTGQLNVYEIYSGDLSKAEADGFRLWDIN